MPQATWPVWVHVMIFLLAAGIIGVAGTILARLADRLADRTGLGEAVTGTIFLGLMTALPGIATSVTAALDGHPALAISNALGASRFRPSSWPSQTSPAARPTSSTQPPRSPP